MNKTNSGPALVTGASSGVAEESSTAQAQALFDVNAFGVLGMTNAVLPAMRHQSSGRIVNVSSMLGLIPALYAALYASTTHAVEGYSESLGHELRTFGIRVVLVEPAYTRTSFEENLAKPDPLLDIYDSARAGLNATMRNNASKRRSRVCPNPTGQQVCAEGIIAGRDGGHLRPAVDGGLRAQAGG